ncbi:hypothetical protein A2303_06640 [Candidatus Falkowbacteria bacterium RIFOXYB2_FULL_47_14]|uniref:Uncharacterized protein n=1 Tax=Candidatus Falkowbacteria bacterium RIFOXYA2_FULL_47_19 TaxID=1797994 RepID=A0A1F5SG56_9BACT|nr:MAG: hypothetical protein A2227_00385 [Candidatus Falkowbacteria bacterium RIFOXYA2_FULL_47_19]OGF43551.1 MAG: hypothetical protein A2303_06640 [Candidatus Falkowbacteria bacterium RIFOXYB2_FULL_47_14]
MFSGPAAFPCRRLPGGRSKNLSTNRGLCQRESKTKNTSIGSNALPKLPSPRPALREGRGTPLQFWRGVLRRYPLLSASWRIGAAAGG